MMAKISLSGGFKPIAEGHYTFRIDNVEYDENFKVIAVKMSTRDGKKYSERYFLEKKDGTPNEGSMNRFSFFARTAMNDLELTEIDHEELVGHYIEGNIVHNTGNDGKTYVNFRDLEPAAGWGEANSFSDLDDLLD